MAGLLDNIERLINEHGSAVILKERIALANDKYAALEAKASNLQAKVAELEAENGRLNLDNNQLNVKIRHLEGRLTGRHGQRLEEIRELILQLVAAHPEATSQQISSGMGINVQLVTFHLTELERSKLVHGSYSVSDEAEWSVAHEGRAYLVRHGLLV
jgi:chromosome segregation ATPase